MLTYFEPAQKQRILELATAALEPGGLLFVGLAESLHGLRLPVTPIDRSVYERSGMVRVPVRG